MAKSVTVQFADGTSHTYENVPDDIDNQAVQDRATMEFADKQVTGVGGGAGANDGSHQTVPYAPTFGEQLVGGAQTAFDYLKKPAEFAMEHPIATGVGISLLPEAVTSKVPILNQAAQYGRAGLQRLTGIVPQSAASAKVGPGLPIAGTPEATMQGLRGGPTQPAPQSIFQRATNVVKQAPDLAQKMRQLAAQRVIPAAGAAAVPAAVGGAVGAGGLAASNFAANQLQSMTPEQRRKYYENDMLGAMGGDTGFAAAIMNRGQ